MNRINKIHEILSLVYGAEAAARLLPEINGLIDKYGSQIRRGSAFAPDQGTAVLITYGDIVREPGQAPLATLHGFLREFVASIISHVHILPFFPYSSDDGFSVIDYRQVNPELGDWDDVRRLNSDFQLMFDLVINHASAESDWFRRCLRGEEPYRDYFLTAAPDTDLSRVVRPRSLPLLTPCETSEGIRHFWTTFSADQVDLNFACPQLLLEMLDILLFYACQGAAMIRLDAIAFLWKQIGTDCLHLPRTHALVQLFRLLLEECAPHAAILTETNVPHAENISYFGNGHNEAHMVYQFSLPPLTAHAILTHDATALCRWAASLEPPPGDCTFFNFLASHDGIGLRPVQGWLDEAEIAFLQRTCEQKGGRVSMKNNPDGTQSPYELNINYYSFLADADEDASICRFLLAHSILMSMPGVPAFYFHSLVGSVNWTEGVERTGQNRTVNREKPIATELCRELRTPQQRRARIYQALTEMLKIRGQTPAFAPRSEFSVLDFGPGLFAVQRRCADQELLAIHNLGRAAAVIQLQGDWRNLRQPEQAATDSWEVKPVQFLWLEKSFGIVCSRL